MSTDKVIVEKVGHVGVLRINRPDEANVVDGEVARGLEAGIDAFEDDGDVYVLLLTGAGERVFSAGMDLKAFAKNGPKEGFNTKKGGFAGVTERTFVKPLVAAVNGAAMGGGFEMMLAADCAVVSTRAKLALPEVKLGLIAAGGGAIRLSRRIPRAVALEMGLTGEAITAERAYELGLVNKVVEPADTYAEGLELAERIASASPIAVRTTRDLMLSSPFVNEETSWARNTDGVRTVLRHPDSKEGPKAFMEKRAPKWTT